MNKWYWSGGALIKRTAKVGKKYPSKCENKTRVCDPEATSFGDACRVNWCDKISY